MIKTVLIIALVLLILFVLWNILRKSLGLLFKIAFFALITLIILGTTVYIDIKRSNLNENAAVIIADDNVIYGGFEIKDGELGNAVSANDIAKIEYAAIKSSSYSEINYKANYSLIVLVVADVDSEKIKGTNASTKETILKSLITNNDAQYENVYDLLINIKYRKIYFFPKTLTLKQIELLNNV